MVRRIALVLGALLLGSASVAAGQAKAPVRDTELVKLIEAYRLLFYSAPQQCGGADCSVQITLTVTSVDGQDICIAKLPSSIQFPNTGNGQRNITWTLNTGGYLVEFPTKNGIMVIDDPKTQIIPDPARTSPVAYGAKNKHNAKGTATYVPVVLYRSAADQPPGVCATGDPQIVNN